MSKVLLVEDDNNLREIYEARLQAEGYDIVTAHDGEEALVVAKAETPDLVISDVMMPKISGFEMLDILRNTDGLKEVKVIMLTALGQSDDQQRADKLGADAYLVKSQVTLEDIVKVAQRLLGGGEEEPVAVPAPEVVPTTFEPVPAPVVDMPVAVTPIQATAVPEPVVTIPEPVVMAPEPVAPLPEPVAVVAPTAPPTLDLPQLDPPAAVEPPQPATEPVTAPTVGELPDMVSSSDETATILSQIEQFEAAEAPAPMEVSPVEEPTSPGPELPPEQYMSTDPLDLASSVYASNEAIAGNNDDVLNTALENLTGLPAVPGEVPAAETPTSEAIAPGNGAVQHGGSRVIAPIESVPKPDLNTLLSIEEAKEQSVGTTIAPIPAQPSLTPAPAQQPPTPAQQPVQPAPSTSPGQLPGQSIDPNSIAL